MSTAYTKSHVKVADELFLIVALLHQEQPEQKAFTVGQILERAAKEGLGSAAGSLRAHASQHAAANVDPDSRGGKYRMVFRERDNRIRLLAPSDYVHPDRHQKFYPDLDDIPEKYHALVEWARRRHEKTEGPPARWLEGLHQLKGMGKGIWKGVDADAYVRGLREGWE
ncbi:hypothetical protein RBB78_20390 [Tunturiibacter empetritectus]